MNEKEIKPKTIKALCLEFVDEDGKTSKVLSRFPANEKDLQSAINFLDLERSITLSVREYTYNELTGESLTPSPFEFEAES